MRDYRCGEIDTEDIFELSVMLLVEYICVDYLPEDDPNDFYGEEYTCYLLMESELDDYLTLKLYHVEKRMVKKDNVVFYLLDSFEVIQQKDAA